MLFIKLLYQSSRRRSNWYVKNVLQWWLLFGTFASTVVSSASSHNNLQYVRLFPDGTFSLIFALSAASSKHSGLYSLLRLFNLTTHRDTGKPNSLHTNWRRSANIRPIMQQNWQFMTVDMNKSDPNNRMMLAPDCRHHQHHLLMISLRDVCQQSYLAK
jgi:hypothetical protein